MVQKFKASLKDGELKIHPNVEKDAKGNVKVYVLNAAAEQEAKNIILKKLAKGESIKEFLVEEKKDGKL